MDHSPIPLYYRIANLLRNKIVNGFYAKGDLIPTEKQLSEEFGVSRVTIRQSLKILEDQGVIYKKQGIGTFVSAHAKLQPIVFTGYIEDIMYQQISTKVSDVNLKWIAPEQKISNSLGLIQGTSVLKVERIRHVDDEIISYVENYFPSNVAEHIQAEDVKNHSFIELLEIYNFKQERAVQTISACAATPLVAEKLQVSVSSPVLFSEIIIYSESDIPVNLVHVYNRSDRYQYTVNLSPLIKLDRTKS